MIEHKITDVELQKMIGAKLRKRLREAGFAMRTSEVEEPEAFLLPINLNLAAHVTVEHVDGCFVFTQASGVIEGIIESVDEVCGEAIANRGVSR